MLFSCVRERATRQRHVTEIRTQGALLRDSCAFEAEKEEAPLLAGKEVERCLQASIVAIAQRCCCWTKVSSHTHSDGEHEALALTLIASP